MRGVISSAMTDTIEELGMLEAFDLVVGTSAGALNAAALLAGVARGCTDEYADGFVAREFINPTRMLLGRPAVDVNFVLDFSSERLDAERHQRTLSSPIPLHCVATSVDDAAAHDLTDLTGPEDLRSALLASSRLPWIGGAPVTFRGQRWLDGGLTEPVPLPSALDAGATHVVVLLTRPRGALIDSRGLTDQLVERKLAVLNPELVDRYRQRTRLYGTITERVFAATDRPEATSPYVMGIALPAGASVPSRLERKPARLAVAAASARAAARTALLPSVR